MVAVPGLVRREGGGGARLRWVLEVGGCWEVGEGELEWCRASGLAPGKRQRAAAVQGYGSRNWGRAGGEGAGGEGLGWAGPAGWLRGSGSGLQRFRVAETVTEEGLVRRGGCRRRGLQVMIFGGDFVVWEGGDRFEPCGSHCLFERCRAAPFPV